MDIIRETAKKFPDLHGLLRTAHMKDTPEEFVKKALNGAFFIGLGLTTLCFFLLSMIDVSILFLIPCFLVSTILSFFFVMKTPIMSIKKRQRELDKEVIFAGRFLQVKLHSGKPLLNALIDASTGYGVAGKYFKEIVDDISMGTSLEKALDNAMHYSPSEKFKRILFQISNALKIGINVSDTLGNVLDEITSEQMIEIKRYSKKLNSLSLFYMLAAIVVPSLGTAIFVVIASLIGILRDNESAFGIFLGVCLLIAVLQFMFVAIFKSTRLSVNV